MAMTFTNSGPKIGALALDRFEAKMGRKIPQPFREFLLETNGGEPSATVFTFRRKSGQPDESAVRTFFSLDETAEYNLEWHLNMTHGRLPPDLFPIADDNCGNLLLMGAHGSREGKIYFWDHEREASGDEPPTEENVYFVADSLKEFLAGLKELRLPAEEP